MYQVEIEFDGCLRGPVNQGLAKGDMEKCVEFIQRFLPPKGYDFSIVNQDTGRAISYSFMPARRRTRLTWAQVFNGKPFPI